MRALVVLLLVVIALLVTVAEPLSPKVELVTPVTAVGAATPIKVIATYRGTGLATLDVRIASPGVPEPIVVTHEEYPKTSWYGSGVHTMELAPVLDAVKQHIPEGPATLEIWASDHSWLGLLHRSPLVSQQITVDTTPSVIEIVLRRPEEVTNPIDVPSGEKKSVETASLPRSVVASK